MVTSCTSRHFIILLTLIAYILILQVKYQSKLSVNQTDNNLFEKKPFVLTTGVNYRKNQRCCLCLEVDGRGKLLLSGRIFHSTDGRSSSQLRQIFLIGDLHVNPSPQHHEVRYSCKECQKGI